MLRNTTKAAAAFVTLIALFAATTATAEAGYGGSGYQGGGYQGGGYRQAAGYRGGHRSHGYQGQRSYGHGHRSYGHQGHGHRAHGYQPPQYVAAQPCYDKVVIDYKIVREPYHRYVTVVDDYGCSHQVKKTFYREVEVPVKRIVKVCP